MIKVDNVTKKFGSFEAVKSVSFEIQKGSVFGIIGENGAGKTTIIKCMTGIYKPEGGAVFMDNDEVYENPKVKAKIGYVADDGGFFPDCRVRDMIKFYGEVYNSFKKEKFASLNDIFNVDENKKIYSLSKGQKMRLSFMLNISTEPELLVLDEPTSGLDPIAKRQLLNILIEEVEERQMSVFISSHHLDEIERLCDVIAVIYGGEIKYNSDIDGLKKNVKKLQVIFEGEPDFSDIEKEIKTEKLGSVYYITTGKYNDEFKDKLRAKGARSIEEVGMSLEEIFIFESEEMNKYDFVKSII